jgi:hypothetical protein
MTVRSARRTRLAVAMTVATATSLLVAFVLIALSGERATRVASIRLGEALALGVPWMAFSIVGAIVVRRRPDNMVGWLCSIGGLQVSLVALAVGTATYGLALDPPLPIGTASAWVAHVGSITIVATPLLILYRFPTGQSLGRWWRRAEALTLVFVAVLLLMVAIDPMPLLTFPTTPNPLALGDASRLSGFSFAPAVASAALAVVSLVLRFRRGSALEQRQLRLLAVASVLVGFAMATMPLTSPDLMSGGRLSSLTAVANAVAFAAIPISIGIAIVRDRLYDIDRIVNRTLVYALVSAVLAGVYGVAVVGLSALLDVLAPGAGNTLATAGSTLLVAALFRPVRSRAQATIDRRFDRERYEAARIIETFAGQVRAEVELDAIVGDLRLAATRTVRPSTTGCWIVGRHSDGS